MKSQQPQLSPPSQSTAATPTTRSSASVSSHGPRHLQLHVRTISAAELFSPRTLPFVANPDNDDSNPQVFPVPEPPSPPPDTVLEEEVQLLQNVLKEEAELQQKYKQEEEEEEDDDDEAADVTAPLNERIVGTAAGPLHVRVTSDMGINSTLLSPATLQPSPSTSTSASAIVSAATTPSSSSLSSGLPNSASSSKLVLLNIPRVGTHAPSRSRSSLSTRASLIGLSRSARASVMNARSSFVFSNASFSWQRLWQFSGPGFLMSIAYLDPGNLQSDLQAGAYTGYQLIWLLAVATIAGLLVQTMSARLGVVTGRDLAQVCRAYYSRPLSYLIWVMTEIAIIGSSIQEIIGCAFAFQLLFGWKLWVGVLVTGTDTFLFLLLNQLNQGIRKLEAFFAVLIAVMAVAFCADTFIVKPDPVQIGMGFLPSMKSYAVLQAVGVVGAVIMPHNLYLHSSLVKTRAINRYNPSRVYEAIFYFTVEAIVALFVSFIINLCVLSAFAEQFFDERCAIYNMALVGDECKSITLFDAGSVLQRSVNTGAAKLLWGVGLLAAGQSSTMTGTFAGQFVMEGFISVKVSKWSRIVLTRLAALVPSLLVALAANNESEHANDVAPALTSTLSPVSSSASFAPLLQESSSTDRVGAWLNVLQSMQLPFALLPLLHFTSSKQVMGQFTIPPVLRGVLWTLALSLVSLNLYLVINAMFIDPTTSPLTSLMNGTTSSPFAHAFSIVVLFVLVAAICFYVSACALIIKEDILGAYQTSRAFIAWHVFGIEVAESESSSDDDSLNKPDASNDRMPLLQGSASSHPNYASNASK